MIPGEVFYKNEDITGNIGRETIELEVKNPDKRPIAVGSHMHFFEVNKFLQFEREAAFGFKLDIPSGTVIRWEPGEIKKVRLVTFGGRQVVKGLNNLTNGQISDCNKRQAMLNAKLKGFIQE
ncbi:urease subunit beta [Hespellia stercorisuis]|uniref:Urease subunit beta n=1 Tax=Hespellia stercorisuis DSM 15480 TaxID=1121950 RepID=A0A1M6JZV6_9FIRM|nr:urease subunit beta [Hespellia stercorisuis]SHJ52220.1 urease subunit beta [Hespellia stercorisuis DSM 15480]